MKSNAGIALGIAALALLTYFQFPGHTYLHQDTQIYIPILEHLWDSSVLNNDILVQRPHVAFTLYDELALALRWVTHLGFHPILAALQIVTRALGIWGVYLIALSLLHDRRLSFLVSGICSLGAAIDGPAVLVMEYEPSPRAFAIPLVFLAVGFMARRRPIWAGWVAAAGFVLHPPSVVAFWAIYLLVERKWRAWLPVIVSLAILLLAAAAQPGVKEAQPFFSRITPELERLQRMRASYNWVSLWWGAEWWKHALAFAVVAFAWRRLRIREPFLLGLPVIGIASVPLSYLLLEELNWGLIPQVQPARTLLFTTAMAILLAAACGCSAALKKGWFEAFAWFFAAVVPPLTWGHWWLAGGLAATVLVAAGRPPVQTAVIVACLFFAPARAGIVNYPFIRTAALEGLAHWARKETPRDAVFVFPVAGKKLDAGVFRSEALRAIYVDWKGGGQVNYLPELGEEWWVRWRDVMLKPVDLPHYRDLGISFAVLPADQPIPGDKPAFQNESYLVYSLAAKSP